MEMKVQQVTGSDFIGIFNRIIFNPQASLNLNLLVIARTGAGKATLKYIGTLRITQFNINLEHAFQLLSRLSSSTVFRLNTVDHSRVN